MRLRPIALLLAGLLALTLPAGSAALPRPDRYVLDVWKSERGLPSNSIFAITQDRQGYLWLGTQEGLARFDGASFRAFTSEATPVMHDDMIKSLGMDSGGILWIGSYMGELTSLRRGEFRAHPFGKPDVSNPIYCLVEDRRRNLWIGTAAGLFYRPAGESDRFVEIDGFAGRKIMGVAEDTAGRLWIATEADGLQCLERGRWRRVPIAPAGRLLVINTMCLSRDGRLWIGTASGLAMIQAGRVVQFRLGQGMSNNIICLLEDRGGDLWAGTENGLFRLANEAGGAASPAQVLPEGIIYSLCEDSEGSLWIGTVGGGLIQMRDSRFTLFSGTSVPGIGMARCLLEDETGGIWFGGAAGRLGRYHGQSYQEVPLPSRFRNEFVWSLESDGAGTLWLGTPRGLLRFHGGQMRVLPLPFPDGAGDVRCILRDSWNRLWVAAWGQGLACLHPDGRQELFTAPAGIGDDRIHFLLEDRKENLWIGSESGIWVSRLGLGIAFRPRLALAGCQATSAYEDRRGALWIGTLSQGLKVLRAGAWGSLTVAQGLFDNRIYAILEDGGGRLWLTSERGIFMARKDELEKAAFAGGYRVRGRLFDESDGLGSRVCNRGSPAAWKDRAGRLWFATLKGVAVADPARMGINETAPPVWLESVGVDSRLLPIVAAAAPKEIPAGSRKFEFTYAAPSFIRPGRIEFKYKLEGYDRDWITAGGRRQAFYNDLRPGRYQFRVVAASADGAWNLNGASFAFVLRPFVYQTWWFLTLAALAFAALSAFAWQVLRRYLRAVAFWKKKMVISHFKILETIGSGGMATVYKAQDLLERKRVVALKVLKEENLMDEAQKRRFRHESLITEQLDHPHIVRIIERGETDGCWYIAMELLPGISLARMIRERGRLTLGDALEIMRQVVDALQAIHAKEIVHRDLKPENIMVGEGDGGRPFVKLLDFGLAITPAQSRLTLSGVVMGTIRYLPPERILDGASSAPGDIYSAGIILYEMLTAAKPFWSEATGEVIHRILETVPVPLRELLPDVPAELEALVSAMIQKDPNRRPALETIADELRRLSAHLATQS